VLKAIVDAWYETAPYEQDDAQIVELVAEFGDSMGMIGNEMKNGAHRETANGAKEEASKNKNILERSSFVAGTQAGMENG